MPLPAPLTDPDWRDSDGERRILWIDDNYPPSRGLTRVLEMDGFGLDYVQTGRAGLGFAAARPYAAIVLDLRLPDLSGLLVLEQLRASGNDVPVVVITGFSDSATEREAMRAGAAAFRQESVADDLAELLLSVAGVSLRGRDDVASFAHGDDPPPEADDPATPLSLHDTLCALRRMLRARFPAAPEDVINDAAEDCLMDFRECPGRFELWRGTSLASFLYPAASRDVLNLLRSAARRNAREAKARAAQALVTPDEPAFVIPRSERFRALRDFLAEIHDARERRALPLWLGGCRATGPLAEALGVSDRPAREQQAEVKRFKDRMITRVKRYAESRGGEPSSDPT